MARERLSQQYSIELYTPGYNAAFVECIAKHNIKCMFYKEPNVYKYVGNKCDLLWMMHAMFRHMNVDASNISTMITRFPIGAKYNE